MDGQTDGRTDGHGETSIPPYNFVAGGIIINYTSYIKCQPIITLLVDIFPILANIYIYKGWPSSMQGGAEIYFWKGTIPTMFVLIWFSGFRVTHTCEPSGGSIFLPILRVPSVPPVNFQNLPPVKKIKYNKILTYILLSIFLEIPHLDLPRWRKTPRDTKGKGECHI